MGNKYYSNACNNNSPETKRIISEKNRLIMQKNEWKNKKTVRERYNVDHVQQIKAISDKTCEKKEYSL